MKAVQILMDNGLLEEIGQAAKHAKMDRSKLVRAAIRRYLASVQISSWEKSDIEAYRRKPLTRAEIDPWRKAQVWPED